jgi:predicted DCC family thiol-disulfide oxidoreductase YuxK
MEADTIYSNTTMSLTEYHHQNSLERSERQKPIVFFDGVCGLCNGFVDVILRADKAGALHFAPLQGDTARRLLPSPPDDAETWSMLYMDERGLYTRSDAALEILRRLGGIWSVLALIRVVPRFLRDAVYGVIARNRYRWFGKRAVCRIPTPKERDRLLP